MGGEKESCKWADNQAVLAFHRFSASVLTHIFLISYDIIYLANTFTFLEAEDEKEDVDAEVESEGEAEDEGEGDAEGEDEGEGEGEGATTTSEAEWYPAYTQEPFGATREGVQT